MKYTPVIHFNGVVASQVNVTDSVPWVYIISSLKDELIYIGQTFDEGGLVTRLASHFGRKNSSSLRKCAADRCGVRMLRGPYLIVAAKLPFENDDSLFSGESNKIRLAIESRLHDVFLTNFVLPKNWKIASSYTPTTVSSEATSNDINSACEEIYEAFISSYIMLRNISHGSPFNLVILERIKEIKNNAPPDIGVLIKDIEILLYEWIIKKLEESYSDTWWSDGVPTAIRTHCSSTREQEGMSEKLPSHAYLTLINIKEILKNNWNIFGASLEKISDKKGKDNATSWINNINEIRKLWAHPLKQIYFKEKEASDINFLESIQKKLRNEILSS